MATLTSTDRAWGEYLAWTRGAAEGQYEVTEERAWSRLQGEVLRAAVVPVELVPAPEDPDPLDLPAPPSDDPPPTRAPRS